MRDARPFRGFGRRKRLTARQKAAWPFAPASFAGMEKDNPEIIAIRRIRR